MNTKSKFAIAGLLLLAIFIWVRDTSWISGADDTLPILVCIPLFFWLGTPWQWKEQPDPFPKSWLLIGAALFVVGSGLSLTFLLGASWCCFFWGWILSHVEEIMLPDLRKLMVLPIMAFPWIALDAEIIGWYFRLTGSGATEAFFSLTPIEVVREGTMLSLNGVMISVQAACSGLHTLQSMLIAGSMVCFVLLGDQPHYWFNIAIIPLMAWVANTIRIICICIAALVISPEFARGPFHDIGGWAILMLMFALCWGMFSLQVKEPSPKEE
jgi:exosortase